MNEAITLQGRTLVVPERDRAPARRTLSVIRQPLGAGERASDAVPGCLHNASFRINTRPRVVPTLPPASDCRMRRVPNLVNHLNVINVLVSCLVRSACDVLNCLWGASCLC